MNTRSPSSGTLLGGLVLTAAFWPTDGRVAHRATEEGVIGGEIALRPWNLVDGKHWQLASLGAEDPSITDLREGTRGECPAGMVETRGQMKANGSRGTIEALQDATCTRWLSRDFPARCEHFDADKWAELSRDLPTKPMHTCIDRFEYPNVKGAYPIIEVSWHEAGALCEARDERLCSEDEWSFACEGAEALPYPNGYDRDKESCVIDRPWRQFDEAALAVRGSESARREIDFLWDGEASGARPGCRSPFGVYDMTGNVDEWTRATERGGYLSILKGGYWGPIRARCRASTRAHDEDFSFYQQGFRCCAEARAPDESNSPSTSR